MISVSEPLRDDHRLGKPLPERVAVVRALPGLGDLLVAVPALRALRSALPKAKISLVGLAETGDFVRRYSAYIDELIEFPGYPGILEGQRPVHALPDFLSQIHRQQFDLALQLHGSGITSNAFTMLLGARRTAGFYLPGQYCPDPEQFFPYPEELSEVHRNLYLLECLGIPSQGACLEFPLTQEDWRQLETVAESAMLEPGRYICIHPGARDLSRRWPPRHFAAVADALQRTGLRIVLTGSQAERPVAAEVSDVMQGEALNLAGRTTLGALAVLLRGAALLVTNDTGVSHLAAALRTPSVVIFITTDPRRWAPLDHELHRAVGQGDGREKMPAANVVLAQSEALLRRGEVYAA